MTMPVDRPQPLLLGLVLLATVPFGLFGGRADDADEQGRQAYEAEDYGAAARAFESALSDYPGAAALQHNNASSLYKQEEFDDAQAAYERAAELATEAEDQALAERSHFGAGNAHFRQGEYQEAIDAYDRALEIDPEDVEAQENKELAERMLQQQQQQEPEESDEGEEGDEPQEDEGDSGEGEGEQPPPSRGGPGTSQRIPPPPPGIDYPPMPERQADDLLDTQRRRERMGSATMDPGGDQFLSELERMLGGDLDGDGRGPEKPPW
ncbi:MAG: tetratricopeptide repeat protein [Armatimonadia bacterium]|nr:tetratricopeptide repeat protein [Armatimonadia bacterium]